MGAEVCLPVADRAQDRTTTTMIALAMNIVDKTRDGTVDGMAVGGAELNYEMQTFPGFLFRISVQNFCSGLQHFPGWSPSVGRYYLR